MPIHSSQPVHQQIQTLASLQGDLPAIFFEDNEVSFKELDLRANRVAHALRSLGVGRESIVALLAVRSPELIIGLLGILKAGAAYLPLDPQYPLERLSFMLSDASASVLLGDADSVAALSENLSIPVLLLE